MAKKTKPLVVVKKPSKSSLQAKIKKGDTPDKDKRRDK